MIIETIIGRKAEKDKLSGILSSRKAEFVAVYGRRRVGKTYLVRNLCIEKGLYFELTGLKDGKLATQLQNFTKSLSALFYGGLALQPPATWQAAFEQLTVEIDKMELNQKIILFFDELPWLANKRSGFMQSLDYVWNKFWSRDPRIKLIVCGSAASWMIDNLINAKGGLYNRVTNIMLLKPLTLPETDKYLQHNGIKFNVRQLFEIYMVMGGIPHYLNQIVPNKSSAQNINNVCFKKDGVLFLEFERIFASLFNCYEQNRTIVLEISKHQYGISRDHLLERVKLSSGGRFNKRISELESSGFLQKFIPYGKNKKDVYYKIIDEYTLFYLRWIEPIKDRSMLTVNANYWYTKANTPEWYTWTGYAFENICYKHIPYILQELGLDNIACEVGTWRLLSRARSNIKGVQIDLIIDREDGIIMLGEIKFTKDEFVIDKEYALKLKNKIEVFSKHFKTKKDVQLLMITNVPLKQNIWSEDLVNIAITLESILQ